MSMLTKNKLASYVEALRPIIYVPSFDFEAFDRLLLSIQDGAKIYEFNEGLGYVDFKTKQSETTYSIEEFLSLFVSNGSEPVFIVLKDMHHQLESHLGCE